jgi:hypothetical protein
VCPGGSRGDRSFNVLPVLSLGVTDMKERKGIQREREMIRIFMAVRVVNDKVFKNICSTIIAKIAFNSS